MARTTNMCRFELENMSTYEILCALDLTQSVHNKIWYRVRSPWVRSPW